MEWLTTIKTLFYIITFVLAGMFALIVRIKSTRKRKDATDALSEAVADKDTAEAEVAKERAYIDLYEYAEKLIMCEETAFNGLDKLMKIQSESAGPVKKDVAFIKLQAYALQKGYEFDIDKWSQIINDLVTFTKSVNVK